MECLGEAFRDPTIHAPQRHHHTFGEENENNLLLMPAWSSRSFLGIKIITACPGNPALLKPSIQGAYLLFDAKHGTPLLMCDAKLLTVLRTAATSALASDYLARKDSKTLLMIGTGSLAPHLVRAHCTVRPIKKVLIWGRNFLKAEQVVDSLHDLDARVKAIEYLDEATMKADIISTATMSSKPLVLGKWVRAGTHVDLVGSYLPGMREADDSLMRRANVYVDDLEAGFRESGDLIIPVRKGILRKSQIRGSLFELCRIETLGRTTSTEITVFKSVGLALEDLAAASLLYKKLQESGRT